MAIHPKLDFAALLATESRPALQALWARWSDAVSLPQARELTVHAASLLPAPTPLKLAVVHTYTSDLLDPWLSLAAAVQGLEVSTYHAPYGLALQEAMPGSALLAHRPDITLLMLRREDLHPDLAQPIAGLDAGARDALLAACVAQAREIVGSFRVQETGQLLLSLLPAPSPPALGLYDTHAEASEGAWWARFKTELCAWLRQACPSTLLLDLDAMQQQIGRQRFFDLRYWYASRFPFSAEAAREFARQVVAVGVLIKAPRAKVLVLDADNTLWGGIIGEDGFDGIALGPEYPGNAYVEFQRRVLDFQQRGLILAMCSKNNAADVDQVLADHPHQILRDGHFAARRVNWLPKPDNLVSLAQELNLGLESFIFVDDSDHECAAVRHALPMVEVVQVPKRPVDVPGCLDAVTRLEVLSLTNEDRAKTALYAQERQRRELMAQAATSDGAGSSHLQRLQMKMHISLAAASHVPRLSQLSKKTNQFNLCTRRYEEHALRAMLQDPKWLVADFSLADVFGDSGIVGLALWSIPRPGVAELDTFLMSCRVIGREAEGAFLHALLRLLAERGVHEVVADYLPTPKNDLVRLFLPSQGFERANDGRYRRDLQRQPPRPASDFPISLTITPAATPQSHESVIA